MTAHSPSHLHRTDGTGDREVVRAVVDRIDASELATRMVSAFRADIDGYRRLSAPVIEGQILEISRGNVELFLRSIRDGRPATDADLGPLRESAKDRAGEGMPLEDLLHAYRLGGRIGWQAFLEVAQPEEQPALLRVAESLMDFVDRISSAVAQAYLEESQHLVSERERQLRGLLDAILAGGTLSSELTALAEQLGIPVRERYRPFAASLPAAAARRHSELAASLRSRGVLALTEGVRVTGLLPDGQVLAGVPTKEAVVAVGVETGRSDLASALDDARRLVDLGRRLGLRGTLQQDDLLPERLLTGAPRVAQNLRGRVLAPLEEHKSRSGADLVETLVAYVGSNLDRQRAAEQLHVHPNTLDYRLKQVRELTGVDVHHLEGLVLVVLALRQRELDESQ